jgi:hypothetical protein
LNGETATNAGLQVDREWVEVVVTRRMKRAIPWVIAIVAVIAAGASFLEMQKARERYRQLAQSPLLREHLHRDVREFMIKAALAGLDQPIVVLGDSITEMARLPESIDDRPVVNAGIGGASISDFEAIAPRILGGVSPSILVVALGANDVGSSVVTRDYTALLVRLKRLAPRLISIAAPNAALVNEGIKAAATIEGVEFVDIPLPRDSTLSDHIHLTREASHAWVAGMAAAIK